MDKQNNNHNSLQKIDELAKDLNMKKSTLYSCVFQRKIPFIKMGRSIRFDRNKINEWLDNNSHDICNL